MTEHVSKAMRRLAAVYGEPQTEFKPELFAEFFAALSGFRGDVLAKAVDRVVRERHFPTWPTVGEVVKACRDVADEIADKFSPDKPKEHRRYEPVDQEVAKALLSKAMASLDKKNQFEGIRSRARAWARNNNCKVTMFPNAEDWGTEVIDEYGRIVPIGWRPGDAA